MRTRLVIGMTFGLAVAAYAASEFTPADYSSTSDVAIRTIDVQKPIPSRSTVLVGLANRRSDPVDVSYTCSIFGEDGTPIANAIGHERVVPPGQEVSSTSVSFEGASDKVACRITSVVPST